MGRSKELCSLFLLVLVVVEFVVLLYEFAGRVEVAVGFFFGLGAIVAIMRCDIYRDKK